MPPHRTARTALIAIATVGGALAVSLTPPAFCAAMRLGVPRAFAPTPEYTWTTDWYPRALDPEPGAYAPVAGVEGLFLGQSNGQGLDTVHIVQATDVVVLHFDRWPAYATIGASAARARLTPDGRLQVWGDGAEWHEYQLKGARGLTRVCQSAVRAALVVAFALLAAVVAFRLARGQPPVTVVGVAVWLAGAVSAVPLAVRFDTLPGSLEPAARVLALLVCGSAAVLIWRGPPAEPRLPGDREPS